MDPSWDIFRKKGGCDLPAFWLRWGSGSCPMVRRNWPRFWYHSWRMPCWRRPGLLDVGGPPALSEETMGSFLVCLVNEIDGCLWKGVEDQFTVRFHTVRTYSFYFLYFRCNLNGRPYLYFTVWMIVMLAWGQLVRTLRIRALPVILGMILPISNQWKTNSEALSRMTPSTLLPPTAWCWWHL